MGTQKDQVNEQEGSTKRDDHSAPLESSSQLFETKQELAHQLRMTDIAKQGLRYTKYQFWIGLIGIVGLLATLVFSAIATRAASKAALVAANSLHLQGRGHLGVSKFTFHRATRSTEEETEVQGFYIVPSFTNSGGAPVVITGTVVSTRTLTDQDVSTLDWTDNLEQPETNIHIAPGTVITQAPLVLNLLSLKKIYNDELRVLYLFKLRYRDLFTEAEYHTHACFELKVYGNPDVVFTNRSLSPSQYMSMEAVGAFGSAS